MARGKAANLSEEELVLCRKAFQSFDRDGSGTIDVKELRDALATMGQAPSDEELFVLIHDVDEDNSGEIDFEEFCKVIAKHKAASTAKDGAEADTLAAFVALGGNPDKSGKVSTDKLRATIKEFELADVDRLIREADAEGRGYLDFQKFAAILR